MAKKSRVAETRDIDRREAHKRSLLRTEFRDALYVDRRTIPEDMEYRWVRESCMQEPDDGNVADATTEGWEPVPASRHPELGSANFLGRNSHMNGFIFRKGLVLCERTKEIGEIERKKMAEHNMKLMTQMPATENYLGDAGIPGRFTSHDTTMSKAIAFGE